MLYRFDKKRNNIGFILYYAVMLILTFVLTKPDVEYGMTFRVGYLAAISIPLLLNAKYIASFFLMFMGIAVTSFAPLPPTAPHYGLLLLFLFLILKLDSAKQDGYKAFVMFFYFFVIEFLYVNPNINFLLWAVVAMGLSLFVKNMDDVNRIGVAFVIISLILSSLYIVYFNDFVEQYGAKEDDLQRASWINQNVYGGVVGCGFVCALYFLTNARKLNISRVIKYISLFAAIISFIALVLNASRGSIIASVISAIILLFTSNLKKINLLVILGLIVAFVVYLYNDGYFDLLIHRFNDDTMSTANGRTIIWQEKWQAFNQQPFYQQLFGIGYENCLNLGLYFDTHNDFMTALYAYGYVGFVIFCVFVLMPFFYIHKSFRWILLAFWIFFVTELMVLSPIYRGLFVFNMFYVMMIKMVKFSQKNKNNEILY